MAMSEHLRALLGRAGLILHRDGEGGVRPHRRLAALPNSFFEPLEQRVLLASVSWDGGGDGILWGDALNWSGDQVPASTDDITIGAGAGAIELNQDVLIDDTGSLTVWDDVTLVSELRHYDIIVEGTMRTHNATIVVDYNEPGYNAMLVVRDGGMLEMAGGAVTGVGFFSVRSGATIALSGVAVQTTGPLAPEGFGFNLADGSTAQIRNSQIREIRINSDCALTFVHNDLSSGAVRATGLSTAAINLENNWWGTNDPAIIESKIYDHSDDAARPWVDYEPILDEAPGNYSLEVDVDATFIGALPGGALTVNDSIGLGSERVRYYEVHVQAPTSVHFDIDAAITGSSLDALLKVFDESGVQLAWSDDAAAPGEPVSGDPYLRLDLAPGAYLIGVSHWSNTGFSPQQGDTGFDGDTGPYTLIVSSDFQQEPPPGGGVPVGQLTLDGLFGDPIGGVYTATGEIWINDLVLVEGTVSYDPNDESIWGSGEVWMIGVSGIGNARLYTGDFRFGDGSAASDELNQVRSNVKPVGLELWVGGFEILPDAVRLRGGISLPDELGGFKVEVSGADYVELSASGLDFSGATITLPGTQGLEFFGLPFSSTGVVVHVSQQEFRVAGDLTLDLLQGGLTIYAEVVVSNEGGGPPQVQIDGGLSLPGPIVVGPGFALKDLLFEVHTDTRTLTCEGMLRVPAGVEIGVAVGISNGYFDSVSAEVSGLDLPILYGPPPLTLPLVYLNGVSASLDELAPGPPAVVLGGTMSFTAGKEITWGGQTYHLLRLDLEGEWDTAGRITGEATVSLGSKDDPFEMASATIVVDERDGLYLAGTLSFSEYLTLSGGLHLDLNRNLFGSLTGTLQLPGWLGGGTIGSARAYGQYLDDGDLDNDFILVGGQLGPWQRAVEFNLNTGDIDWWADYEQLDSKKSASPKDLRAPQEHHFSMPSGLERAVFRAAWETGTTDLQLTNPQGNVYTIASTEYHIDPVTHQAVFELSDPAGLPEGDWTLTVISADSIGAYTVELRGPTIRPWIALTAPAFDATGGVVTINWDDEDSDSDALISLYYDTDRQGADGTLICSGISEDSALNTYDWVIPAGLPTARYFVYAVIDDGVNEPTVSYATGAVDVLEPGALPAPVNLGSIESGAGWVLLHWDAVSGADHYVVRLNADAAGEGYTMEYAAGDGTELLISGLTAGETYRVSVSAVDATGVVGHSASPVLATIPGTPVPPAVNEWAVVAAPDAAYQAQVPGDVGDTYTAVQIPTGATLSPTGLFAWAVPADAAGWYEVLVHVTDAAGTVHAHRFMLLADGDAPALLEPAPTATALDTQSIEIVAPLVVDASGGLEYALERDGMVITGWQTSRTFQDSGIQENVSYTYRVLIRDRSTAQQVSTSDTATVATLASTPGPVSISTIGETSFTLQDLGAPGATATEYALYIPELDRYVATDGSLGLAPIWAAFSVWQDVAVTGLNSDTPYSIAAIARNLDGIETGPGTATEIRTLRETVPPTVLDAAARADGVVQIRFSEGVILSYKAIHIEDSLGHGVTIPASALTHQAGEDIAILQLPTQLPMGEYTLRLDADSILDLAGNPLVGDSAGNYITQFWIGGWWGETPDGGLVDSIRHSPEPDPPPPDPDPLPLYRRAGDDDLPEGDATDIPDLTRDRYRPVEKGVDAEIPVPFDLGDDPLSPWWDISEPVFG